LDTEVGVGALALVAAEEGTSLLALAAAKAKDDPPVSHEPYNIDVDKEIHGEDDYMPPPDALLGNKRLRMMSTCSNCKPTLVPPDE
jgi:hypothetical protein